MDKKLEILFPFESFYKSDSIELNAEYGFDGTIFEILVLSIGLDWAIIVDIDCLNSSGLVTEETVDSGITPTTFIVCISICLRRSQFRRNSFPHLLQLNGLISV